MSQGPADYEDDLMAALERSLGCSCARIRLGSEVTESRNWNPDCPVHGTSSPWWNSPEQIEKRAADGARVRDLQRQAREARARARNGRRDAES